MTVQHSRQSEDNKSRQAQTCPSCRPSDLEVIATQLQASPPLPQEIRWNDAKLGNLQACAKTRLTCQLCKFICDVYELDGSVIEDGSQQRAQDELNVGFIDHSWCQHLDITSEAPYGVHSRLARPYYGGYTSTHIFLEQSDDNVKTICPRLHRRPDELAGQLDYNLIEEWLQHCRSRHALTPCWQRQDDSKALGDFHLIDVASRQVVVARPGAEYVALSYVWGKEIVQADTKKNNNAETKLPQALPAVLPQTIADAVVVTRELGLPYLWIDLYCISQDNPQHIQDQISRMDKIYGGAQFTIVALDGDHANAGLPGVSRPLLKKQQPRYTTTAGTLVATYLPMPNTTLSAKAWDTRAWTMQEHLLSKRRLIMDSHQVIWKCKTEYLHDCLPAPNPLVDWTFTKSHSYFSFDCDSVDLDQKDNLFATFSDILSVYTTRRLSVQADILNACQGMLTYLTEGTRHRWLYAHPEPHMLTSLLWKPHFRTTPARHDLFPSWSWLGWQGALEYSWWLHSIQLNETIAGLANPDRDWWNFRPDKEYEINFDGVRRGWEQEMETINDAAPSKDDRKDMVASWSVIGTELTLETIVTRWTTKMVRNDGSTVKPLLRQTVQSLAAIGDHWTLLDKHDQPLKDVLGEHTMFETADHFFRTSPEVSKTIGSEVLFATINFYNHIIDSKRSYLAAKNIVAGLVLAPQPDGKMLRLASIAMPWHFFQHATRERARVVII